ncbi:MAG: methyltransferase domain-containing protein [Xanthobacteraceae bacterium]|jgi:ubiquinone/menaquinone biosynthesis C-methylase UbiE
MASYSFSSAMTDFDPDAFRDFERAAHSRKAESYHGRFAAVTDRAIGPLLEAAKVRGGTRLLDVAAGPGHLAAAAAQHGARVTGVDLAPAMVALASKLHPDVSFREASADRLPFPDASFDAVTCAFGVGHFPDPVRVLAEFARVLAPGGIAALAWWDGFERNRINGIFHEALLRLKISAPGVVPAGPPIDRYSDCERFAQLLRDAGLNDVRVEQVSFEHSLRDADQFWDMAMGSFARASSVIGTQSEQTQREIREAVSAAASRYKSGSGLAVPVAFLVAAGTR